MSDIDLTDEEKDITNKGVLAIWRDGWKSGDKHGFKLGFKAGSQTLGHHWFFLTTILMLFISAVVFTALGIGLDIVTNCGPDLPCGTNIFTPDVGWFKNG